MSLKGDSSGGLKFGKGSRTKRSFKDECDINSIMAKYRSTGLITHLSGRRASYGDFTGVSDYQSALNEVLKAQEMFLSLPAHIRKEFRNDPALLIEALDDPKQHDKLVELGIFKKSEEAPTAPASDAAAVNASKPGSSRARKSGPPVTPLDVTGGTDTQVPESGK